VTKKGIAKGTIGGAVIGFGIGCAIDYYTARREYNKVI